MFITIALPENAELIAEKGKRITHGDPLYRVKQEKNQIIDIAQKLAIQPKQIFNCMIKMVGEKVKKNEVIALKKSLLSEKKIYADYDGIIQKIDHRAGLVILHIDKNENSIVQSFFTGIIHEKDDNRLKIYLEKGNRIELEATTNDWGGELFYFTDESLYFTINEESIKNKTVIIEYLSPHIQVKCEALGAIGFACMEKKDHTALPHAVFKKKDDYTQLIQSKKSFIICSAVEKIAIIYE